MEVQRYNLWSSKDFKESDVPLQWLGSCWARASFLIWWIRVRGFFLIFFHEMLVFLFRNYSTVVEVSQQFQNWHKVQHEVDVQIWFQLYGVVFWFQRHCKNTEFLPCNPGTLPLWMMESLSGQCTCCCVWICYCDSIKPKTCRSLQTHFLVLFCWCCYMKRPLKPSRSTPPPSNSGQ